MILAINLVVWELSKDSFGHNSISFNPFHILEVLFRHVRFLVETSPANMIIAATNRYVQVSL